MPVGGVVAIEPDHDMSYDQHSAIARRHTMINRQRLQSSKAAATRIALDKESTKAGKQQVQCAQLTAFTCCCCFCWALCFTCPLRWLPGVALAGGCFLFLAARIFDVLPSNCHCPTALFHGTRCCSIPCFCMPPKRAAAKETVTDPVSTNVTDLKALRPKRTSWADVTDSPEEEEDAHHETLTQGCREATTEERSEGQSRLPPKASVVRSQVRRRKHR
jgi:hypothetical protein